jgi:catechol 2,3-dioxygenase-like lactoylglutathione lyase family enzyme
MFKPKAAFSGFSVNSLEKAKTFYGDVLGLKVDDNNGMGLILHLPEGGDVFVYEKPDHQAATFTILNFNVANIDEAVDELKRKGLHFERYDNMPAQADEKGIMRGLAHNMGPDIAWFKDPAGNILSVLQDC